MFREVQRLADVVKLVSSELIKCIYYVIHTKGNLR